MSGESPLKILVARRPDSSGKEAEEFAAWFARTCPVEVKAVTILPTIWPSEPQSKVNPSHKEWIALEKKGCQDAALKALDKAGVPKKYLSDKAFEFVSGPSETEAITAVAQDFEADFVILGSCATAPKGRFRAGSTADALLHCAPVSLGLAPRSPKLSKHGVTRVNCAYVDTEQSKEALRKACDLAHRWGVPVRLLAFAPRGASMYPTETTYKHEAEDMIEWREQALALLDRGRDRALARHADLDIELGIGSGYGWSGSMDNVNWKKGDLLVVGSSMLGVFGHVFLGSSTNQIVRNSPVPCVIVPV